MAEQELDWPGDVKSSGPREEPDPVLPDPGDDEPEVIVNEEDALSVPEAVDAYDGWEIIEDTGKATSTQTIYVVLEVGDADGPPTDWAIRVIGRAITAGGDKKAIDLVRDARGDGDVDPGWIAVPERSFRLRRKKREMVPRDSWAD
jgi:hypothetical protein